MLSGTQADYNKQVNPVPMLSVKLEYISEECTPFTAYHINPLYLPILFFISVSTSFSNLSLNIFVTV